MHDLLTIPDYPLTQEQIDQYRRDGFIQLDGVITGPVLEAMREAVVNAVAIETNEAPDRPTTGSQATYAKIFNQKVNLWQRHPDVARFTPPSVVSQCVLRDARCGSGTTRPCSRNR